MLAPLITEAGDKVLLLTRSDSCTHTYDPDLEWPWLAEPPPPTPDHGSSSPNEVLLGIPFPEVKSLPSGRGPFVWRSLWAYFRRIALLVRVPEQAGSVLDLHHENLVGFVEVKAIAPWESVLCLSPRSFSRS